MDDDTSASSAASTLQMAETERAGGPVGPLDVSLSPRSLAPSLARCVTNTRDLCEIDDDRPTERRRVRVRRSAKVGPPRPSPNLVMLDKHSTKRAARTGLS